MTTDLQARLREDNWVNASHRGVRVRDMCLEAADEIARLTAMVERLEIDREASGVALRDMHSKWETAAKNEAKADALAEAAQGIVSVRGGVAGVKKFDALQAALTDYRGDGK